MPVLRFAWLCPLALAGCVRDDPNHCANQKGDGDVYCAEKYEGGLCSSCNANHDGCVDVPAADIPSDCRPDNVTTAADAGSTSDPSATSLTTDTIADDSATETSGVDTTSSDGSSSETTGPPQPECGNGVMEPGEACDTDEPIECAVLDQGDDSATCDPETCRFDTHLCSETNPFCGDRIINRTEEECDVSDFDEQTCDMQPGHGNMGELVCTAECEIDASGCCLDASEPCELNSQCCSGLCGVLEQGPNCVLGN